MERTALLIIDVQVGLVQGQPPIYQAEKLLQTIAGLLSRARHISVMNADEITFA